MKKLLIIVMACYGLNARAQVDESKDFLYFYSDSVAYAQKIMLRPDIVGLLQLRADSRRVATEKVKFFNNKQGFFANTRKLTFTGTSAFSERVIEGKINLFQEIIYDPFPYPYNMDYGYEMDYSFRRRRQQPVNVSMYYNKGYSDLKKVNYNNLKRDMADNKESIDLLNSYRKSLNSSRILYVAAGASVLASFISLATTTLGDKSAADGNGFGGRGSGMSLKGPNFTPAFILFGLGAGLTLGGYSLQMSSSRRLESALDAYNR